jgi:hypothetical protein
MDALEGVLAANRGQMKTAVEAAELELSTLRAREQELEALIRRARFVLGDDVRGQPTRETREPLALHDAIATVLRSNGNRAMTAREIADAVNRAGRYSKRDGSAVDPGQIHSRVHVYGHMFERTAGGIRLRVDLPKPSSRAIVSEFDEAMYRVYENALRDVGYGATRFLTMVRKRGGIEAARHLLAKPGTSEGFQRLADAAKLDLTMEYQVLRPRFSELFTASETQIARDRLLAAGLSEAQLPVD